jgi:hypothetical protein
LRKRLRMFRAAETGICRVSFGQSSGMLAIIPPAVRKPELRKTAWWTNRGQTGHWEIVVFPPFSKVQKPANDAPKGGVRQSARSRHR